MRPIIFAATMLALSLIQTAFADGHTSIAVPSESFSVKGEMMNLELTDSGGVITVKALAGKYGRAFLTYNMSTNPNSKTQGSFTGRGMGIDDSGNIEFSSRRGIWSREGTTLTFHSLDDLTDGTQNLSKAILDISTGKLEMTFYPM